MPAMTPRTETVVLLQGDDEAKLRELRGRAESLRNEADRLSRQVARLKPREDQPSSATLSDPSPYGNAVEAHREAEDAATEAEREADEHAAESEERGVKVILRAVTRKKWSELTKAHPPRSDDDTDEKVGVNLDEFPESLVPACIGSPAMNDDEREEFLDSLSPAQWDKLATTAWALCMSVGADPKARLGSVVSRN